MSHVLKRFLEFQKMAQELLGFSGEGRFNSLAAFVLEFGRPFEFWRAEDQYRYTRGRPQQCYRNAAELVVKHPDTLVYVEGYAAKTLPVLHAWCVELESGRLIDSTWSVAAPDQVCYFGIPFQYEFLAQQLVLNGVFGLIDRMEQGYPLLTNPEIYEHPEKWVHPELATYDKGPHCDREGGLPAIDTDHSGAVKKAQSNKPNEPK